MGSSTAKIAVSKATYWIDRPYDYSIPDALADRIRPGVRVMVRFSRSERLMEGIVLAVTRESSVENCKPILSIVEGPVLDRKQIALALYMREHFFCTVYDAVRVLLPAGAFTGSDGRRKVKDAMREIAVLNGSADEARAKAETLQRKAPQQAKILEVLADFETLSGRELLLYSGAQRSSLKTLEKKGLLSLEYREVYRRPALSPVAGKDLPELTEPQADVFAPLCSLLDKPEFSASLLYGVTGSGKTVVYSHLIRRCLDSGRSVIFLVPEIALTPQFIREFSSYFGNRVAILHSSLRDSERYDEWKRAASGEARLIIGTRSAVFTPVNDLGLIIIDEEHEDSYKSESSPRYDAREIARYRCREENCALLLGSATPDLVSMYRAGNGEDHLFTLPDRFNSFELPEVRIVDMKQELLSGNASDISSVLRDELTKNLEKGEQSLLFLNRRGTSRSVSCVNCGYVYRCPRCSVSLTYHGRGDRLICHYCGHTQKVGKTCPECGGPLNFTGSGTQSIETQLAEIFPDIRTLRLDADAVSQTGTHEAILNRFIEENTPVLIGTQMIGKGHNFPNVTLSAVLSADQSLYAGDYRAAEKTFSLLTQVIGRSGRAERKGRAVIQTFTPENPVIRFAASQDYLRFYNYEIEFRRIQEMPPFRDLIAVLSVGREEQTAFRCADHIRKMLESEAPGHPQMKIVGPAPLPVARVNEKYRFAVYITGTSTAKLRNLISNTIIACNLNKEFRDVSVYADPNPI